MKANMQGKEGEERVVIFKKIQRGLVFVRVLEHQFNFSTYTS